jgi:hypothetical protein
MVVTGAGSGSGTATSIVKSPLPTAIGAVLVPRGRTLQQPVTGSQRYSSSVSPSSRGRSWPRQCHSSCSTSWAVQSTGGVRVLSMRGR